MAPHAIIHQEKSMKMTIANTKTFIPFFNHNQELPEDEQIVVTYKVPDIKLKNTLKPRPKLKFNYDSDGRTTGGETEVSTNKLAVVSGMLVSIKHFGYEDERGEHKISKWDELVQGPVEYEPLVDELYDEFMKELDRGIDEKN